MMLRTFLPVGQGAFYCEQFEDVCGNDKVTVIYDCGSKTSEKRVEEQIKSNFEKGEVIHAVFISHLHDDHINGIPYLLKYCHVKNLFFPLITREHAKYIRLYHLVKYGAISPFLEAFLANPYAAIREFDIENRPSLHQIGAGEEDDNGIDAITIPSGENVADTIFGEDYRKYGLYGEWVYIPHNFKHETRVKQLQRKLNSLFGKDMKNEDLQKIWESGTAADKEKIMQAYDKVAGDFNTNSMTLYSGMKGRGLLQQSIVDMRCMCISCCCCISKEVGCLYTGDYDASGKYKWRELMKAYRAYWDNIGCVQVPHHGSGHNYNTELSKMDAFFIISAGKGKRYRHPHGSVLRDLLFAGHIPYVVTEDESSRVNLMIHR